MVVTEALVGVEDTAMQHQYLEDMVVVDLY